jgi:multicomponent Na+:H+ antiporter subunit A
MVSGAGLALLHTDLKRLLAYSTVSALGVLTMLLGLGTPLAAEEAMIFLLAHALYKGALFLVAGIIEHETGTRDVRRVGGLGRAMPLTAFAAALAALSMAGLPPMFGFVGKEFLYETALESAVSLSILPVLTVATGILFVVLAAFAGLHPFWGAPEPSTTAPHEAPVSLWLGPLTLGLVGVAFGLVPNLVEDSLLAPAVTAVLGRPFDFAITLWHGVDAVLILTIITVAAGAFLYTRRRGLWHLAERAQRTALPGAASVYAAALRGLDLVAVAQTRVIQNGYLRIYLLTTVAAVTVLGWVTLTMAQRPAIGWTDIRFYEAAVAVVIVAAALAAARSRSRLGAAAALGVVGYGIALEYLFFGAPDLALTQFMVETLTVILFVLVFYHLPRFAVLSSRMTRVRDAGVAVLAGGLMTALLLSGAPAERAVSAYFARESVPGGHGRNIVNVILVDFRGLDTLGEITVLSVAALGVFVLLKLRPDVPGR